jgi:hypothetical protein
MVYPLPPTTSPLYNHPLPALEYWLETQGCQRDPEDPEQWYCHRDQWQAVIKLEETHLVVRYTYLTGETKTLSFPYALSRADIEQAAFGLD